MTNSSTQNRGFTLLEVLIAVVVLAFGLLGVVAVFPAVIDVQRRSQDAVLGGSLAASAEALINSSVLDSESLDWIDWEDVRLDGSAAEVRRFPARELLTNSLAISAAGAPDFVDGEVEIDFLWDSLTDIDGTITVGGGFAGSSLFFDASREALAPEQQLLPAGAITFDVGQRLLPDEASGDTPRYIWDLLVRRVDIGIGVPEDDDRSSVRVPIARVSELPIEVMVIVRPVDRGIRVPAGLTLRDTLRGYRIEQAENGDVSRVALNDRDRRFPVAVNPNNGAVPQPGIAFADGGRYSAPIVGRALPSGGEFRTSFQFRAGDRRIRREVIFQNRRPSDPPLIIQQRDAEREFAQIGQLFVSDGGAVHRVTRVATELDASGGDDVFRVEFEPPLPAGWRQIVFTPQVPADIRVIRTR